MIDTLVGSGLVPDPLIRFGIRRLLRARLAREDNGSDEANARRQEELVRELRASPIALSTEVANQQHYEVPAEFFQTVLGRRLKYSSAYWPDGVGGLDAAEEAMLELSAKRAGLRDGQDVLELGCGWGSMTLFMAERFPASRILAVSNSSSQRLFIEAEARRRGLDNVEVKTIDMRELSLDRRFDRVVSIEMFEHMRNYEVLLERISGWLRPEGRLFVHIFCHSSLAYPFEVEGSGDWMARYFFTDGMMPSAELLLAFSGHLVCEERWGVNGTHYERTALAWLRNMDESREALLPILEHTYGRGERDRWWSYWRIFFLACAELFGFRDGEEWLVGHYRFKHRD